MACERVKPTYLESPFSRKGSSHEGLAQESNEADVMFMTFLLLPARRSVSDGFILCRFLRAWNPVYRSCIRLDTGFLTHF